MVPKQGKVEMERLVVGQDILDLVLETIKESDSYAQLCDSWRAFARELKVREYEIHRMHEDMLIYRFSLFDLLHKLLSKWKAQNGKMATLKILYDSLMACGLKDIAEYLEQKFCHLNIVPVDKLDNATCNDAKFFVSEKKQRIRVTHEKRGKVCKTDYDLLAYALAGNVVIALVAPIAVSLTIIGFTVTCYLPKIVDKFAKWNDELRTVSGKVTGWKKKKT